MQFDLSGEWQRSIGGKTLDCVRVPGCYPPVGECTLATEIGLPEGFVQPGARCFLVTEGVLATAEFAVNGRPVGQAGPFVPYRFELPADLMSERVAITAVVRDVIEPFGTTPGRRFDAGLFRRIYLERRPAAFLESVAFRYELSSDFRAATCAVHAHVDGPPAGALEVVLRHRESGEEVARARGAAGLPLTFEVSRPRLWSPERPDLYSLEVRLDGDDETYRDLVGFRRIEVAGQDFLLNGERLLLKGVCRHEFTTEFGYTVPEEAVRRDLERIKAAGFNYVRLVHSPQAACVSRLAAEIGLLVTEEPGACWHDLAHPEIAAQALETLRRTVLRDRNCPSVFAWLLYNECPPVPEYAVRGAALCRELQPGCLVSMADSSFRPEVVKPMAEAAGLSYYGINRYGFADGIYVEMMETYSDRPLVFTEWGGWWTQANLGVTRALGECFITHTRPEASPRMAGFSLWVWQDWEEYSRPEPFNVAGVTIEGLIDQQGNAKPDLAWLSEICAAMGREQVPAPPEVQVLLPEEGEAGAWAPVPLPSGHQSELEARVEGSRKRFRYAPPQIERLRVGGIDFALPEGGFTRPLLLGPGQEEIVIPVSRVVRAIAVLGHVALLGGYPSSNVWSVYHEDREPIRALGQPASRYEFVFEDETVILPLQHGLHILRANDICRWWHIAPRAPETVPAARAVLHPSFEILRYDLWQQDFGAARSLREIRWRLEDADSIQGMLGVSVRG